MEIVAGIVKSTNEKLTKEGKPAYGLNILGEWYNGFGKLPANKGDTVEIEFERNGTWNNIKRVISHKPIEGYIDAPSKSASPPARGIGPLEAVAPHKPNMNPPPSSDLIGDLIDLVWEETDVTNVRDENFEPEFATRDEKALRYKIRNKLINALVGKLE